MCHIHDIGHKNSLFVIRINVGYKKPVNFNNIGMRIIDRFQTGISRSKIIQNQVIVLFPVLLQNINGFFTAG